MFGIEDRRQLVVLHVDGLRGGLRRFTRFGRNCDHILSDEPYDVVGEHGPIEERAAEVVFADIAAGEHRVHAGHLARGLRVDRDDARVWYGARHERSPQHPGLGGVGCVRRRAADFRAALEAHFVRCKRRARRRDRAHSNGSLTIGVVWNS